MLLRNCWVECCEFRGMTVRQNKEGKDFIILRVEDDEGTQNEITATGDNVDYVRACQLKKGDIIDLCVTIVSGARGGRTYAYASLAHVSNPVRFKATVDGGM